MEKEKMQVIEFSSEFILNRLIEELSKIKAVQSIGISGGELKIPEAGQGDIDIFIYCDEIPDSYTRQTILKMDGEILEEIKYDVFRGGHWGCGDYAQINGVETWLMYFTVNETEKNVTEILTGKYLDKLDNYYYPIGRLAMLKDINVMFDRNGFLCRLSNKLNDYPNELSKQLAEHHLAELNDVEDLERAITRKDVLFYHFALDLAIDHFLQVLFSLNKKYFPSRKRSMDFVNEFKIKPDRCNERLLEVLKLGGCPNSIGESYETFKVLISELILLYDLSKNQD